VRFPIWGWDGVILVRKKGALHRQISVQSPPQWQSPQQWQAGFEGSAMGGHGAEAFVAVQNMRSSKFA